MAMKAFGILLTATVAFASPNESRRQLQEGPCADLDGDGDTDVSDLLSLLAAFGVDDSAADAPMACALPGPTKFGLQSISVLRDQLALNFCTLRPRDHQASRAMIIACKSSSSLCPPPSPASFPTLPSAPAPASASSAGSNEATRA